MKETVSAGEAKTSQLPGSNRLVEVVRLFLRLGFTAFGGPVAHIAMMRQEVVQRRAWLSDDSFVDLLGIINLIPGPNSTQLAIYLGYLRAGPAGLIAAGVCFIGPAMLIVMTLAWLYVSYGTLPEVGGLLYGIKAIVIAIIAQALWGLCRTVLKGPLPIILALIVMLLYLLGVNGLLLFAGAGLFFGLVRWTERGQRERKKGRQKTLSLAFPLLPGGLYGLPNTWYRFAAQGIPEAMLAATPVSLLTLFLTFLKIGATLYGSGYVILAFLRGDFVQGLGWLNERQLLDAISIGQFTPGPVFTTATFIGYLVKGWQGALVATLGIFLPSFLLIAIIHPLAGTLRRTFWTAAILDGINIAALALMCGVLLQLGQNALLGQSLLLNVVAGLIALVSLLVLLRFKINSVWLIIAGGALGLAVWWVWH